MGSSGTLFPVPHKKLSLDIKFFTCSLCDGASMHISRAFHRRCGNCATLQPQDGETVEDRGGSLFVGGGGRMAWVGGNKTDLVVCSYDDHFLVIATQIGAMGSILHARKEEGMSILPTYTVSVIFGKRDEATLVACARQLIEHISVSGSSKKLVLSLGLRDHSVETLKGIVAAVTENCLW